jgi:gamma-glutamyltranspeptidase/glutathione hydrolase
VGYAVGYDGVVAAGHPAVADAGIAALAAGGNAVDAAVAAMFTSFHAEPLLNSAAGGGFAVAEIDGERVAVDFFASAPGLAAGSGVWRPPASAFWPVPIDFGTTTQTFHVGPGSVAVPGVVPGLLGLATSAGRLPLDVTLGPAFDAATRGTVVTPMGAVATKLLWPIITLTDEQRRPFEGPDGGPLGEGATYHNPDLARLIEAARRDGPAVLTRGPIADALCAHLGAAGGGVSAIDLNSWRSASDRPIEVEFRGAVVSLPPGPTVAGMWVAAALAVLDGLPSPEPDSEGELRLLREVFVAVEQARGEIVGAATPNEAHRREWLDAARISDLRRQVAARLDDPAAARRAPDDHLGGTTHVSVIDRWGNACSITTSNGEASGLVVPGYGIFLNNFLGEEDINPMGFHQLPAGARLGSAMCPMLLDLPDGTRVALGSGGSARIRTALLQVVRRLARGEDARDAVAADRAHVDGERLLFEATRGLRVHADTAPQALNAGVFPHQSMYFGGVHVAVRRADGTCEGVGDPRRSGAARVVRPA